MRREIYIGDNLDILRRYIAADSVDLIYLDPPFKSDRNYNRIFARRAGARAAAQEGAFEDTWEWTPRSDHDCQVMMRAPGKVGEAIGALYRLLGGVPLMAYIAMMAPRLLELKRVLKPTGSIYLHCDSTANHYLKILMDAVFMPTRFRSQITWKRTSSHGNVTTGYGDVTDVILYYARGDRPVWNQVYRPYSRRHVDSKFRYIDPDGRRYTTSDLRNPSPRPNLRYEYNGYKPHPNGWAISRRRMEEYDRAGRLVFPASPDGRIRLKRYLDEQPGERAQNLWDDIAPVNSRAVERVGFPTQKPNALLRRIIEASSRPGEVVLDPFCGCGTAVIVAEQLGRQWVGIDITDVALEVIQMRFDREVGKVPYVVKAREPRALPEAIALAKSDRKHFETWALGLVGARPAEPHRGADRGVDARFLDLHGRPVVVSVKSGHVSSPHIRDLIGVIDREGAVVGAFISLYHPTKAMLREAASAGSYESATGLIPRLQIHTIAQLLDPNSHRIVYPPADALLTRAPRERPHAPDQFRLPLVAVVPARHDLPMQDVGSAAPPPYAAKLGRRALQRAVSRASATRARRRAG